MALEFEEEWGKGYGIVFSIHIIGEAIAVGIFLLLSSIVGLIGALNHHQFGVSCSCLAIDQGQQSTTQVKLLNATWRLMSNDPRQEVDQAELLWDAEHHPEPGAVPTRM
ncbi:unnamed protein product [Coregonus sp. 'balchen']|nr:unnamed protein product [Coregonus sp. 'balchen']